MQKNSDRKRGAIISAAVIVVIELLFISIAFVIASHISGLIATFFLFLYVAIMLAVITGTLVALARRLKELKNNEAEEAKKY